MSWRRLGLSLLLVPVAGLAVVAATTVRADVLVPPLIIVPGVAGMVGVATVLGRARPRPPVTEATSPDGRGTATPEERRRAVRAGLTAAGVTFVALLAAAGLAVVAGPATGPVLLLAGFVAAGWAWSRVRRHPTHRRTAVMVDGPDAPPPRPGTSRPLDDEFAGLSTPALGREWQSSLHALLAATDPDTRRAVVDRRRRCLDELERRDPVALGRWLAVDPGPGRDPTRWFTPIPDDLTDPPAPEEHRS